jgi:hypothetical protein
VLALLLRGDFDLVHYAGHGDFDEQEPDRVGWLFAGGLLTLGSSSESSACRRSSLRTPV